MKKGDGLRALTLFALVTPALATCAFAASSTDGLWQTDAPSASTRQDSPAQLIQPRKFQAAALNGGAMEALVGSKGGAITLSLPMPDGSFESFAVEEYDVMAPGLKQWLVGQGHDMKTFRGTGIDDPTATVRIDWGGPEGFHAQVIRADRDSVYIDPLYDANTTEYASYYKNDLGPTSDFQCLVDEVATKSGGSGAAGGGKGVKNTGGNVRTYRLAVAATGEYTTFHGGAAAAQAAITTVVNRLNGIYGRDIAVQFQLVANNNLIVYTNSLTDPYSGSASSPTVLRDENQPVIDGAIGDANYDIGHVFAVAAGGYASLQSVCVSNFKARGASGTFSPVGDSFSVQIVAHEMGHQFGAGHTFNSPSGSCSGSVFAADAYEPGSGSTIMSYAGICFGDDVESQSDDYFHLHSIEEMLDFITSSATCYTATAGANPNAPTVSAGPDYVIPANTPFELRALSGNDVDGGTLTYTWEEFDLGPIKTLASADNGLSPIIRSQLPSTDPVRSIPTLAELASGVTDQANLPSSTTRQMTFRAAIRDNNVMGGRVGSDTMLVTSVDTGAPFAVTYPNTVVSLSGETTVTWNVSETDLFPISASTVDILLSTDGGLTYPTTLASGVANSGSYNVVLPNITSSTARVRVQASSNIFFDISNANFSISPAGGSEPVFNAAAPNTINDSTGTGNGNSKPEPGESPVALTLPLTNTGTAAATGITATLTSLTGTVSVVSGNSGYANLGVAATTPNTTPFTINVSGSHPCGTPINLQLAVASNEGTSTVNYTILAGSQGFAGLFSNESFEAGAIPSYWTTGATIGSNNWHTVTSVVAYPHAGSSTVVFQPTTGSALLSYLESPSFHGVDSLTFWHSYSTLDTLTGMVLEVSANGGPWTDLGAQMTSGGYNSTISFGSNPLDGRNAWSGDPGSFNWEAMTQVVVNMTPYVNDTIKVRWVIGDGNLFSMPGWTIDDITFSGPSSICQAAASSVQDWTLLDD